MVQKIKKEYDSYLEMVRKKLDKLQNNPTYGRKNVDKYFSDKAFMAEYKL